MLTLGIASGAVALVWGFSNMRKPYRASVARIINGIWIVSTASLIYWAWDTWVDSAWKTAAIVVGNLILLGAIIEIFKPQPLISKKGGG